MNSTHPTAVWRTAGEALRRWDTETEQPSRNHVFHRHTPETLAQIHNTPAGKGVYGYRQAWVRLHANRPAPTVMGCHGGVFVHPWPDRRVTPKELSVLQDFRDAWYFVGSKADLWTQIGNTVPIGLAKPLGESCLEMFEAEGGISC